LEIFVLNTDDKERGEAGGDGEICEKIKVYWDYVLGFRLKNICCSNNSYFCKLLSEAFVYQYENRKIKAIYQYGNI
jgi:hypothetical protein